MGKTAIVFLFFFGFWVQSDLKKLNGKWKEVKREWVNGRKTDAWGDPFKPLYELNIDLENRMVKIRYAGVVNRESKLIIMNDSTLHFDNTRFKVQKLASNELVLIEWPIENPEDPSANVLFFKSAR